MKTDKLRIKPKNILTLHTTEIAYKENENNTTNLRKHKRNSKRRQATIYWNRKEQGSGTGML